MKITVITDQKGQIIGTARFPKGTSKETPALRPVPKSTQKVHEIELPAHLEEVKSADELHRELAKHIAK